MASPQRLPSGDLYVRITMFIYTIQDANNMKEIYIGKTNNFENRRYSHIRNAVNGSLKYDDDLYKWMRLVGIDNLVFSIECECDSSIANNMERATVKKYEDLGYRLHNKQLTSGYVQMHKRFEHRDEVYDMIVNQHKSDTEAANIFGISKSLIKKIMSEYNYHKKSKLYYIHEEIQQKIISGVPIRELAKEYGVCKNAISNINRGKAFYNPSLHYPLNENVRDKNLKDSWFKSKV